MAQAREGQIITFYSFKGGTGRTMALANVAWILAASGKRVLMVDWDLESPGLYRYFGPFLSEEAVRDSSGVIDMIHDFESEARKRVEKGEPFHDVAAYARVTQYTLSLDWEFPGGGTLDLMSCGRQNSDYPAIIGSLGWDVFYEKLRGAQLFTALRAEMKTRYDYTLIDSRTGFGDIAGICTFDLPDTLINCFTLNTQGIEGAASVAGDVAQYRTRDTRKKIRVLPVPMRVENGEKAKVEAGRSLARRRLGLLPEGMTEARRDEYWTNVVIPYQPFYAYEETLATFGDDGSGPMTLLGAYERLARYITDGEVDSMPAMNPGVRDFWRKRFERADPNSLTQVLLDYQPEDEAWAEWIERVLAEVKIAVARAKPAAAGREPGGEAMSLTILSHSSKPAIAGQAALKPGADQRAAAGLSGRRAVYVSDMPPLDRFPLRDSEYLAGRTAAEAVQRLTHLVGADAVPEHAMRALLERYPFREPKISNTPVRNTRFTGRAEVLHELRARMRLRRTGAQLPPVALLGPGGMGKTQLALEYAYRYKSEYDVIWWIQSGQTLFVDTALSDLGEWLTREYDIQVGSGAGATSQEVARAVVRVLGRGEPIDRWLLVLDDADDPRAVRGFIPSGAGHVLITSRDRRWEQYADPFDVEVFKRPESIAHLSQRVPEISPTEADRLADALGDLPLAVAVTGAWLGETGTSVAEHLHRLERHGALATPEHLLAEYPEEYPESLAAVLDNSLEQVRSQSVAAHRLLQLCAFMAGEGISLRLIYSQPMVSLLARFDRDLTEAGDVARLVQLLNRLALIKLDPHANQFQIHRLLQTHVQQRLAESDGDLEPTKHEVHTLLADSRPRRDVDDPETWPRYRMLWPHLEPSSAAQCQKETVRNLLVDRVRYMWQRGSLPEAAQMARTIEHSWQQRLDAGAEGEDSQVLRKQLLHLRFNLGNILRDQSEYQRAFELDSRVSDEQRTLLGPEHRHALMTAMSLAADLRALGRYQEALALDEATHKSWTSNYGEVPQTLSAANNLAVSYRLAGRYSDARKLDDETYEARRNTLGDLHPRTLHSASAIGWDLREAGRYADSVAWLKDQLAAAKRQPEPHPRMYSQIEVNLAASLRASGRFAEAEPYLKTATTRLEELYGGDHADTLAARLCHAANLLAADDAANADREMTSILTVYRRLFGAGHPLTLVGTSNHVAVLRSLGEIGRARESAEEAARLLGERLGPDYPYTLAARMNLAVCLADSGRLDDSRAVDQDNVDRLTRLLGPAHPDTLRAEANMLLTGADLGQAGAGSALDQVIARLGQWIGRDHPTLVALRKGTRVHRVLDPQAF